MVVEDLTTTKSRIRGAARARDFQKVQELWLDLAQRVQELWLDLATAGTLKDDLALFLDVATDVAERGDRELAGQLLLALLGDMRKEGHQDEAFDVARWAARFAPRARGLREELLAHYRRVYETRPGLEGALKRSGILVEAAPCDKAVQLLDDALRFAPGDFCSHRSGWGIGRVSEARPETGEYLIDFARKRGQRMDEVMARTSLEKRDQDDLDALLWTDKDRVRRLAAPEGGDPLSLLKSALKSSGGKLQARDLKEKLSGDVLDGAGWKRFWDAARKLAKDDPWIEVGAPPKSLITKRQQPLARSDEVGKGIDRAGPFAKKLETARRELLALQKDARGGGQGPPWLKSGLAALQRDVKPASLKPRDRAVRIEIALFKLEAAATWPAAASELGVGVAEALAQVRGEIVDPETGEPIAPPPTTDAAQAPRVPVPASLAKELDGLPIAETPSVLREMTVPEYRRQIVRHVRAAFPADAAERLRTIVLEPAPGTFDAAVAELAAAVDAPALEQTLQKVVVAPVQHPDAYAALARAWFAGRLRGVLKGRQDVELVAKGIQLLDEVTHKLKTHAEQGGTTLLKTAQDALRALFSEKSHRAISGVIEHGSEGDVRRILQLVRQSPSLTPTVIRATENFVVGRFPLLLSQIVAAPKVDQEEDAKIFTTLDGRKKREQELNQIMDVELEEVRLEIGRALEFGDISENSELDAARERQRHLADQAERMRLELERAHVIDLASVDPTSVRVGTRVTCKNVETARTETFTILGPWDVDDAHGIISHLSPIAKALLAHSTGDEVNVQLPGGARVGYAVLAIEKALQHQES